MINKQFDFNKVISLSIWLLIPCVFIMMCIYQPDYSWQKNIVNDTDSSPADNNFIKILFIGWLFL